MRRSIFHHIFIIGLSIYLFSCSTKPKKESLMVVKGDSSYSVSIIPFGKLKDGQAIFSYTLKNKNGLELSVINFGGIVTSIKTPDRNGVLKDIVLGFDNLDSYEKTNPYFGAIIGRYGNRIANGKFALDGKNYTLAANDNGKNHLHGGNIGFNKKFWNIETISRTENPSIKLTYFSKDGEEGYPGNLKVEVSYTLTEDNEWKIEYSAETDMKTVLNLTQHTYFNLTGNSERDILDHQLQLNADEFIPIDKELIPMGMPKAVDNTPFDFRKPSTIGKEIDNHDTQLTNGKGYDHAWILQSTTGLKKAGAVYEAASGRLIEFSTTEPAIQFYSGNFLDGALTGKLKVKYGKRFGLCLETEHFPDSPNHPEFPSVVLKPGNIFHSETIYKFSVR